MLAKINATKKCSRMNYSPLLTYGNNFDKRLLCEIPSECRLKPLIHFTGGGVFPEFDIRFHIFRCAIIVAKFNEMFQRCFVMMPDVKIYHQYIASTGLKFVDFSYLSSISLSNLSKKILA